LFLYFGRSQLDSSICMTNTKLFLLLMLTEG
jgi:hypothetical protein